LIFAEEYSLELLILINKPNDTCIAQNIIMDLGNMIINSYYYIFYKNYIIENLKLFIIKYKAYINTNNIDKAIQNDINNNILNIENNYDKLEAYELKNLVKNILNNLDKAYFNDIELITKYTLRDWIL